MFRIIKEDFKNNSFRSFLTLFFYRVNHRVYKNNYFFLAKLINSIIQIIKILFSVQNQISYKDIIGINIRLPHIGFGVIISAKVGKNSIIDPNVVVYEDIEDNTRVFNLVRYV